MGERGYLASMRNLFLQALKDEHVKTVLVMDDDALLHCNFNEVGIETSLLGLIASLVS